jgi:hypothetical protein
MRLVCAAILVLALTMPARAEDVQGWSFSGSFNGSSNSDGTILKAIPALTYTFNTHLQTYTGIPFYFVNVSSSVAAATTGTSTSAGFKNGIGNAFIGGRVIFNSESVDYSSTLELTAPTGDKARGFSTGRVTADWTNRFSHRFNSFTPFGSVGLANTISDTNFFVRPFTSLGLVTHFEGGGTYNLSDQVHLNASGYAIRAAGNQTIISREVSRASSSNAIGAKARRPDLAAGTTTKGGGKENRVFTTSTQTVAPSSVVNDSGASVWLDVSPRQEIYFYGGYSRSMHYDYNTVFYGIGLRIGK